MPIPNILCSRCCLAEESTDHIFVNCLWARSVWWNVFRWLKITTIYDDSSVNNLLEHVNAQVGSKRWKKMPQMVTFGCLWTLWLARNEKEFNGNMMPVQKILELIKEETFMWVKSRAAGGVLDWKKWLEFDISV
ncbi:hypothetical protein Hanom_Chr01g00068751 [Helianthus anomalus]